MVSCNFNENNSHSNNIFVIIIIIIIRLLTWSSRSSGDFQFCWNQPQVK